MVKNTGFTSDCVVLLPRREQPVWRRRSGLNSSCGRRALLLMPAAAAMSMALGVALATPARAQSTIPYTGSTTSNQVNLGNTTNYPNGNPFTVGEGHVVAVNGANAIIGGSSENWSLSNFGFVSATGGREDGVNFGGGGTVLNESYLNTTIWHYATISGVQDGIYIHSPGTVANLGLISAGAQGTGVYLNQGGALTNDAGGDGADGVITGGLIGVQVGYQIRNPAATSGIVTNSGVINGTTEAGVLIFSGVDGEGLVENEAGGTIISDLGGAGVSMYGRHSSVQNDGNIYTGLFGTGVRLNDGGVVRNQNDGAIDGGAKGTGVYVYDGGSVINDRGYIYGGKGIDAAGAAAYVLNSGSIAGTTIGVDLRAGGLVANVFHTVDGTLYLGNIYGRHIGVELNTPNATVVNAGYIGGGVALDKGTGVLLTDGGTVANYQIGFEGGLVGGTILGGTIGIVAQGGAGTVFNSGFIAGESIGVALYAGGLVDNSSFTSNDTYHQSGLISGDDVGVYIGSRAGTPSYAGGVINAGTITGGSTGVGIYNVTYGGVINTASGIIAGYDDDGVKIENVYNFGVMNAGSIAGEENGVKFDNVGYASVTNAAGGAIYGLNEDGVKFYDIGGAYLDNTGTILGRDNGVHAYDAQYAGVTNGPGGTIFGFEGDGIRLEDVTLNAVFNAGTVIGDEDGVIIGDAQSGYVTNAVSGTIFGYNGDGVGLLGVTNSYVYNAGTILGANNGILAGEGYGAQVTNALGGMIGGMQVDGVQLGALEMATLYNAGTILGFADGVSLGNIGYIQVANMPAGTIAGFTGDGIGVYDIGGAQISNAGSIYGFGTGVSVQDFDTGTVVNEFGGKIIGYTGNGVDLSNFNYYVDQAAVYNGGSIWGSVTGAGFYNGGIANLVNQDTGVIIGFDDDGAKIRDVTYASVYNAGSIGGFENGIHFENIYSGVNVTNAASGFLYGVSEDGLKFYNAGVVNIDNAGTILGAEDGVHFWDGVSANITNEIGGTITGTNDYGVKIGDVSYTSVFNAGTIYGPDEGVYVFDGVMAQVTNAASGVIFGYNAGVDLEAAYNYVDNRGYIGANEVGDAGVYEDGISAGLINRAGGTISGFSYGGNLQATYDSVVNAGLIQARGFEGYDCSGYDGVYVTGSIASVTNLQGGIISGFYEGVRADTGSLMLSNDGLITAYRSALYAQDGDVASIYNGDSGEISGQLYGALLDYAENTLVNLGLITGGEYQGLFVEGEATVANAASGTIQGGQQGLDSEAEYLTLQNAGVIQGYYNGVELEDGTIANLLNQASGTILAAYDAIDDYAQTMALDNAGVIAGTYFDGLFVDADIASVLNEATGTIAGGAYGIQAYTDSFALDNAGLILGAADDGVYEDDGSLVSIMNQDGGTIAGERYGVWVDYIASTLSDAATLFNAGLITGGSIGVTTAYFGNTLPNVLMVTNTGTIAGGRLGVGLYGQGGGVVTNTGTITGGVTGVDIVYQNPTVTSFGTVLNGGLISGGVFGVEIGYLYNTLGNTGIVTNSGTITGGQVGVALYGEAGGILTNTGTITGGSIGAYITYENPTMTSFGTILNAGLISGGTVGAAIGYFNNTLANPGFVSNAGTIAGGTVGLALYGLAGGTVLNAGSISGGSLGVEIGFAGDGGAALGMLLTSGVITAGTIGALLTDGGLLENDGGTISGGTDGAYLGGGASTVTNSGTIIGSYGTALQLAGGGAVTNSGAINGGADGVVFGGAGTLLTSGVITAGTIGALLTVGGLLENEGGTISGGTDGAYLGGGATTVTNTGTIIGSYGTALQLAGGGAVTNSGAIHGGADAVVLGAAGTVDNTGLISGGTIGVEIGGAGTVTNAGSIQGGVDVSGEGMLANTGDITGGMAGVSFDGAGIVTNAGLLEGSADGVDLAGGDVTNSGTIKGGVNGVDAGGNGLNLTNTGTIIGTAGDGVIMGAGTISNAAGALIDGGIDGVIAGSGAVIDNAGVIMDAPSTLHAGIKLLGTDQLTNEAGGTISGAVGVLVTGDEDTIVNAGTIISTDGGDSIQVDPGADPVQITLTSGSMEIGNIDGGGTGGQITLIGSNTLANNITNFGPGSQLTVTPGADWIGSGNWTIETVDNEGTFQGGQIGTPLVLNGNLVSTGNLVVLVTPTVTTQILATGTAMLSGDLTYEFAPGFYKPEKLVFLTAAGGVTADGLKVNYEGSVPAILSHTTNNGIYISDGTLGSNLVLGYVLPEDISIYGDAAQTAAMDGQSANTSLLDQATESDGDKAAACAAEEGEMGHDTSPAGSNADGMASQMAKAMGAEFCKVGGWIAATGTTSDIDGGGGADGYSANAAGFLAGVDRTFGASGTRIGIAAGYDTAWLKDDAGGKASVDTVRVGLYGAQPLGAFTLAAEFLYGHGDNKVTRETGVGADSSSFGANDFDAGAQLSTAIDAAGFTLTPAAGVRIALTGSDRFAESAPGELSAFAVKGKDGSYNSVQPYAQIGLSHGFATSSGIMVTPSGTVGFTYEAGNNAKSADAMTGDGTQFASGQVHLDNTAAKLSAGLSAGKGNWSLYARYSAYVAGNWTSQTGEAGLQVKF